MTRGKFILLTDHQVYESIEFNGGMYPNGLGDKAFKMLKEIETENDFIKMINNFNTENYNYDGELIFDMSYMNDNPKFPGFFDKPNFINFNNGYFERFFSDWIFIKNISNDDVKFKDRNRNEDILKVRETIRLHYGRLCYLSRKIETIETYDIYGNKMYDYNIVI